MAGIQAPRPQLFGSYLDFFQVRDLSTSRPQNVPTRATVFAAVSTVLVRLIAQVPLLPVLLAQSKLPAHAVIQFPTGARAA